MPGVLIVEDHHLVRTGLRNILEAAGDITIVGEAESGEAALRIHRERTPDVILMDISLPGLSGIETSQRILAADRNARIVVLTAHDEPPFPGRLLDMGALGYLTKACEARELLGAIRAVCDGRRYIGSEIAQQLAISLLPGATDSPFAELSGREMEVTLMLTRGMNSGAIAEKMSLSPKTVATYKQRIYEKTGVSTEVELLKQAIRHGILPNET